jgi:hypothetical protein
MQVPLRLRMQLCGYQSEISHAPFLSETSCNPWSQRNTSYTPLFQMKLHVSLSLRVKVHVTLLL